MEEEDETTDGTYTLRSIFGLNKNRNRHGGGAIGPMAPHSTHLQSRPPKPWPRAGQTGMPNQAPTMMASRMMQQTSTPEDTEYWMGDPDDPEDKGATFDPPYTFPRYYSDYMKAGHDAIRKQSGPGIKDPEHIYNNMEESLLLRSYLRRMILEYRDAPVQTSAGMFVFTDTRNMNFGKLSGNWDIYKNPQTGMIIGVFGDYDGYVAYNLEDGAMEYSGDLEDAIEKASHSEMTESEILGELEGEGGFKDDGPEDPMDDSETPTNEVSAVGGGAMGMAGQPSGQIRGYTGPLGMKGGNSAEKKRKKNKKHYEPSMRAWGDGSEVD